MNYDYVAINLVTGILVYPVPDGQTPEEVALYWDPEGTDPYAGFFYSDFDPACYNFPTAFTLTGGVVGFDLTAAKGVATSQEKVNYATLEQEATEGYSTNQLSSQASLASGSRLPEIQAVLDAVNVLAVDLSANLAAIDAATTIDEVNNVVNPPTGILFTGRGAAGPLDLNVSYYTEFNSASLTEADTELYVPGTSTVIAYGSGGPGQFDSIGNCFVTGDYLVQIREVATSRVIAEFECPLAPANTNVAF
jgi:hypothetical protein